MSDHESMEVINRIERGLLVCRPNLNDVGKAFLELIALYRAQTEKLAEVEELWAIGSKLLKENTELLNRAPTTADRDAIREALREAIAFVEDEREVRGDEDAQYEKPATPLIEKLAALAKRLEVTS